MQTTFIGPDGQEYSLDQASDRTFRAEQDNGGVWHFVFFDQETGESTFRYHGPFPTAFDRDLWTKAESERVDRPEGILPFALSPVQSQVA